MLLELDDIHKSYPGDAGPAPVLRGVSLSLEAGQTLALTGESGSGKSTLLHMAAGLEVPDRGRVLIGGTDIASLGDLGRAEMRRTRLSVIFQQFNLIPSLDVAANLAFQARLAGREDHAWQTQVTRRLGLDEHTAKYPEQLSGGQQQRVAIGRALAVRPDLVLADEPTGNLDEALGDEVITLMLDLVAETGASLLMVTHSDRLAGRLGSRLHLSRGQIAA
ncbi:MAG: ABC transporter ATP-binding protein [Rhodobacteraceae bacterium]|nr:ABC transporter ATP-binding protein [Paracoccaceae bacterium]